MVKINMMCGKRDFGPDWFSIDGQDLPHIQSNDIYLSTWPDESVDLIYCSHGIAYFDRDEIIPLLQSWKRVLKPGGVLRLATPDWDALRELPIPMLGPLYGKMNNPPIYHKVVYCYKTLAALLESNGFHNVRLYDHNVTIHAQFDDHSAAYFQDKLISLNIECNA